MKAWIVEWLRIEESAGRGRAKLLKSAEIQAESRDEALTIARNLWQPKPNTEFLVGYRA